jgi:hypothetical protein
MNLQAQMVALRAYQSQEIPSGVLASWAHEAKLPLGNWSLLFPSAEQGLSCLIQPIELNSYLPANWIPLDGELYIRSNTRHEQSSIPSSLDFLEDC